MFRLARALPWRPLLRFSLAGSFFLVLWLQVADAYVATLIGPANRLLAAGGTPIRLAWDGRDVLVGIPSGTGPVRIFRLAHDELTYLNLVAALALLLAVPGLSRLRRGAWCLGLAATLWATHVVTVSAGSLSAVSSYFASLPAGGLGPSPNAVWAGVAIDPAIIDELIGAWTAWASPALLLVVAALVVPRHCWRDAYVQRT